MSSLDAVILPLGAIAAFALGAVTWWWGFIAGFVLLHFFLFCNVFRISRRLELIWAGVFIALAGCTIALDVPGWSATAAVSLAVTIGVLVVAMCKPSYHGIAWRRINPDLPAWWETHVVGQSGSRATE